MPHQIGSMNWLPITDSYSMCDRRHFPKNDCNGISHSPRIFLCVAWSTFHWVTVSMFPPLESGWPCDYSGSDTIWLGRIIWHNLLWVLLGCWHLPLSYHDVRKSKQPVDMKRHPSHSPGRAPICQLCEQVILKVGPLAPRQPHHLMLPVVEQARCLHLAQISAGWAK